jgi:hypothetical protein
MVALYNTRIEQVPAVFIASMFSWEKRPFFRADEAAQANVDTNLDPPG